MCAAALGIFKGYSLIEVMSYENDQTCKNKGDY